jgi:hypothetical protein
MNLPLEQCETPPFFPEHGVFPASAAVEARLKSAVIASNVSFFMVSITVI